MSPAPSELLVRLLTQHHDSLFRYIHSLVGNADDARDVMQETSVALFEKSHLYDESLPFLPWAYRFGYIEVLKWRAKCKKAPLALDDDVIELLSIHRNQQEVVSQQRVSILPECFRLLSRKDLRAIRGRYFERIAADELARSLGMSRRKLFRELERIRRVLLDCIESKLSAQDV